MPALQGMKGRYGGISVELVPHTLPSLISQVNQKERMQ